MQITITINVNSTTEVLEFFQLLAEREKLANVKTDVKIEGCEKEKNVKSQAKTVTKTVDTEVTFDTVKSTCANLIANNKSAYVKELLTKYGASKVSEIKQEDYKAVMEDLKIA